MRIHKEIGRVVSGFLAALTLAVSMPYAAAETDRQTIRVAFPTQEGMSFFGHSGKVTGYNYDYLEKISEYTGWEMEYVPYGSADGNEAVGSALSDLASGQVDLMGPLLKNAATDMRRAAPWSPVCCRDRTWTRTSPCPGTATPSCWPP